MNREEETDRSQDTESSIHGKSDYKRVINFLVVNRMYPIFSKNGKIFFKKPTNTLLSDENAKGIIDQLNLKTAEDCRRIREIVREIYVPGKIINFVVR